MPRPNILILMADQFNGTFFSRWSGRFYPRTTSESTGGAVCPLRQHLHGKPALRAGPRFFHVRAVAQPDAGL